MTAVPPAAPDAGVATALLAPRVRLVGGAAFAAVVQVFATLGASHAQPEATSLDVWAFLLLLAGPAALLVRHRRPVLAWAVAFASTMTYVLLDYPMGPVFTALLIAYVNVALRGHRRIAWAGLVAGYVLVAWVEPGLSNDEPWPDWAEAIGLGAWLLVLAVGTELAHSWLERAADRARARAEEERRRAGEERLRIARELHDVLAHNISLINVRAGVALHLVEEQPDAIDVEQVRDALAAIKDASKDGLGELRSVLDVLRQDEGEAAPLAPTAGLDDLDALAERARGTGLDVRVECRNGDGSSIGEADVADLDDIAAGLTAGVSLAAFRVVQEALTNVVRHAGATRATVRVRRSDDVLEVQVDDDGIGPAGEGGTRSGPLVSSADGAGEPVRSGGGRGGRGPGGAGRGERDGGRGIAGMRERALALGGTLEAGPRPGRGFRVRATFPLGDEA